MNPPIARRLEALRAAPRLAVTHALVRFPPKRSRIACTFALCGSVPSVVPPSPSSRLAQNASPTAGEPYRFKSDACKSSAARSVRVRASRCKAAVSAMDGGSSSTQVVFYVLYLGGSKFGKLSGCNAGCLIAVITYFVLIKVFT